VPPVVTVTALTVKAAIAIAAAAIALRVICVLLERKASSADKTLADAGLTPLSAGWPSRACG
jgi:hypothetical protein